MKKLFFLLLLISQASLGQTTDTLLTTILSPAQMQEDFGTYRRMLEETHPGLYRYTSKNVIQELMDSVEASLSEEKPFFSFYTDLALINAKIKCSHSLLLPSRETNKYLMQQVETVPFYFFGIGEKVYVGFNGSTNEEIKPGFELMGINGRTISEIQSIVSEFGWADGDIKSKKMRFMSGAYFWMNYYLFVDRPDEFTMKFKDLQGNESEHVLKAQTPRLTLVNYKKNPVNDEMKKKYKQKKDKPFKLTFADDLPNTAILSLKAFAGKGINDEDVAQLETRKFMDKAIKKVKNKGATSMIVDLRSNGGGWDIIGMEILSYLVKSEKPYQYYREAFAVTDSTEFFEFTGFAPSEYAKVKEELELQADGTFALKPEQNVGLRPYQPKENRFQGDLYFLIDELTGSAASEFAGLAKHMELGVFVGNETYGAYQGGNGSTFIRMPLPNSGIFVTTPLVSGYQDLTPQESPNRGVLPHHYVMFEREDLLKRYDRQLAFVKDLIRKK